MNKKIIIPSIIILIIFVLYSIIGDGKKIQIMCDTIPSIQACNDSIELKVYVENSGSMDAYMCSGSNLKEAVFDYISDLKDQCTTSSFYYINSTIIPYKGNLTSYIKDLTPNSFAKAGGNKADTDLGKIFDMIMKESDKNTVSVLVSDCILDIPQNALDYLGICQVSIKNTFKEALKVNPMLGVEIIKLDSKFEGYWYCGKNKELLKDVIRPYYIWVMGNQRVLAAFNKKTPVENIIGGIKEYCAYADSQTFPFDIEKKNYVLNNANKNKIKVDLLIDLSQSLQKNDICINKTYFKTNESVEIKSINRITSKNSKYSHVIQLEIKNPSKVNNVQITFSYPSMLDWVILSNDLTGTNVKANLDKTTGIESIVRGVAEAYKDNSIYGTISFDIKNK